MNRDFSQTAGSLYCLLSGRHIFVSALQEHATIFASKFRDQIWGKRNQL
jgi:hypothetical protein